MERVDRIKPVLERGITIEHGEHGELSMWLEGNLIMMAGSRHGNHDIPRSSSTEHIAAMWMRYISNDSSDVYIALD